MSSKCDVGTLLLYLTSVFLIVSGKGIFQMRIEKFQLDEHFPAWKCCPEDSWDYSQHDDRTFSACLAKCQFQIKVCLETYRPTWNVNQPLLCPLGSFTAGLPSTHPTVPLVNISFPVTAIWQENFTLIIDVLNDDGNKDGPPNVLFRLPSTEINITSRHTWQVKSFGATIGDVDENAQWSEVESSQNNKNSDTATATRKRGGIGLTILTSFQFSCLPDQSGPRCEEDCNDSSTTCQSSGHGVAICPEGFDGNHCDKPICNQGCENGECVDPNVCKCQQGWTGENCSLCKAYPGCQQGRCQYNKETGKQTPLTCTCEQGWGGMLCDIDLNFCQNNKNICRNHGKCENVQSANNQPYQCVCQPGFRGDHCEMIQHDCQINGCQNEGECTQHSDGQNRCLCPSGFYGSLCEFNQTECSQNPCQAENSICQPLMRHQRNEAASRGRRLFICNCPPGYSGGNCEINIDECATQPCKNGAFCEDLISSYRCICPPGFSGVWCEKQEVWTCATKLCPKGSTCTNTAEGVTCSPLALAPTLNNETPKNYLRITDTIKNKENVVMVHLQPSFLSLTIGVPLAIALCGLLLAFVICIFMGACLWYRNRYKASTGRQILPLPEDEANAYASETSTTWSNYEPISSLRKSGGISKRTQKRSIDAFGFPLFRQRKLESSKERGIATTHSTPVHQRYSENPSKPYSMHMLSSMVYDQSLKSKIQGNDESPPLPPRPKTGPIISYPTILRPIFYQLPRPFFVGQKRISQPSDMIPSPYAIIHNKSRNGLENPNVYTILQSNERIQMNSSVDEPQHMTMQPVLSITPLIVGENYQGMVTGNDAKPINKHQALSRNKDATIKLSTKI